MSHFASIILAAALGFGLVSSAQAQNYAPSVNYETHLTAQRGQDGVMAGRSAYVATTAAPYLGRARTAPLGYQGAIPARD